MEPRGLQLQRGPAKKGVLLWHLLGCRLLQFPLSSLIPSPQNPKPLSHTPAAGPSISRSMHLCPVSVHAPAAGPSCPASLHTPAAGPSSSSSQPSTAASQISFDSQWEGVDESKPTTSLQLRLADGSRMVARFNHSQTVAHIRRFIAASRQVSVFSAHVQNTQSCARSHLACNALQTTSTSPIQLCVH